MTNKPQAHALVTGGAGFIGAHVARHLLNAGYQVTILDDLSGGYKENIPEKATFVQASVVDHEQINKLFDHQQFDYVFHLAAYAAEGLSHFIRRYNYTNNLIGSINLINAAVKHRVKCFVFTSSIAVYGKGQLPMTEDLIPVPEDPYGIAKLAVEQDLQAAHDMFGLNYIIFRPHNVYGELQNIGDPYRNVIGIFMNQLLLNKELTVFGDGSQTRAFSYIDDVAPYIARSIEIEKAYNTVFNIGADQEFTVLELANQVMAAMGIQKNICLLPERKEVKHAWADHSKAGRTFNIHHYTSLEKGLQRMADWVRTHGARSTREFSEIEVHLNMPESWKK